MTKINPFRRFWKKPQPASSAPEHFHSWKPISVKSGEVGGYANAKGEPLQATEILQECSCGDYRSIAVWGTWSLEDVKGGELAKDVQELNRWAAL